MSEIRVKGVIASTYMARGAEDTVEDTPHVRKLIGLGYLAEVTDRSERTVGGPAAEFDPNVAPPRNAKRDRWAAYLDLLTISYSEKDNRDALVERYDRYQAALEAELSKDDAADEAARDLLEEGPDGASGADTAPTADTADDEG